jgi:hypothetical protein
VSPAVEFHHVEPYAVGGRPTVDNIRLRCRAHNRYEAQLFFGPELPEFVRESQPEWLVGTTSSRALLAGAWDFGRIPPERA